MNLDSEDRRSNQQPEIVHFRCSDGYSCAVEVWGDKSTLAATRCHIVMLHGIISHAGWYHASSQHLADHGHIVHFVDRRGSGRNDQDRGDVNHWTRWAEDVEEYVDTLPKNDTVVIAGISWGGKLAVALNRRGRIPIAGMMLICPGLFANQFPSPWKYALLGGLRTIGLSKLRVPIPVQDPALFTNVPAWQDFIQNDERTLRKVTVRFALADRKMTAYAREEPESINIPTLLILAGNDRMVRNDATRDYLAQIKSNACENVCFDEAAHTFEFEADTSDYFRLLNDWCCRLTAHRTTGQDSPTPD